MFLYYEISYFCYYFLQFFVLFNFFAEGKPIPTELRNEEAALRHEIDLEDENTAGIVFWAFLFIHCLVAEKNSVYEKIWVLNLG